MQSDTEALYALSDAEYSEETEALLKEAMRQAANDGAAARYFENLTVTVGGKTGTSQVTEGGGKIPNAIFCGFAPYDTPEVVVSCILLEGESGYRAAYTVGKGMEKYFELYGE